ncbi:Bug family tripartite tricarboxylate transporter substrate binding protein [Roseomonas populi]|uniref:Tripartite tricarboxylate transporter substrate binding protein n=1 Tax=Roseomonas populi TaxID=3121582 RepID=A0ABT1XA60_9PROT|nr:tripartite tricarboxylate transporter substrate binding protein [Roseomonas pecuniae]MCR0984990.1 tripartite tricarboxylate transporter substrate binding protein [Roseomonas pecuniae]
MQVGRRGMLACGAGLALGTVQRTARAQTGSFPMRTVRVIVSAGAGSGPDTAMRLLADRLSTIWGQPVVVDNRGGGSGNIGAQAAARSERDGHVLLFSQASPLVLNAHLMRAMPFDPARDLTPVTLAMTTPFVLAARPGLGVRTLPELAARARESREGLTFATGGATSLPRFAGEQLARGLGIRLTNVPYGVSPQALQDTVAGRTDLVIDGTPLITPQLRAGLLTPVAITSAARFPGLEEVPTAAETLPAFEMGGWFALLGPGGMPPALAERIAADAARALAAPELRDRLLRELGAVVSADGPAALATMMERERATLGRLVRELEVPIE